MFKKSQVGIIVWIVIVVIGFFAIVLESSKEIGPEYIDGISSAALISASKEISSIASGVMPSHLEFEIVQEDKYIHPEFRQINDTHIRIEHYLKEGVKELPKGYDWGTTLCTEENISVSASLSDTPIPKITTEAEWCVNSNNKGYEVITKEERAVPYNKTIKIPKGFTDFEFYGGNGSYITVVTTTDEATGGRNNFKHRIVYDQLNNRWHVVYIDSASDMHTASSSDGTTWTDGIDFDAGTWDYDDFSCVIDHDASNTYLHCTMATNAANTLHYKRCELTGSTPFIASCGSLETVVTSGDGSDDVEYPSITIDSNDCVLIAYILEDDSEPTSDEREIWAVKEGVTCGDGDFDAADAAAGTPFQVSGANSFNGGNRIPVGIESFGDLDAQIFFIDNDVEGSYDIETVFFNGSSNTTGTIRTLDADVEGDGNWHSESATIIISQEDTIVTGADDGTNTLDIWRILSKGADLDSQVVTGVTQNDAGIGGAVAGYGQQNCIVVDTIADGANDLWVFSVNDADPQDIYYVNSTDGGTNWNSIVLWEDEASIDRVRYLNCYFENSTCDIIVNWLGDDGGTNYNVSTKIVNTGSCEAAPPVDTCDCPGSGDWEIDCSDNCDITENCDMQGNNIFIVTDFSGVVTFNANVTNYNERFVGDECLLVENQRSEAL